MKSKLFEELLPSAEEHVRGGGGKSFNEAATKALLTTGGSKPGVMGASFAQSINPAIFFDIDNGTVTKIDAQESLQFGVKALLPELAKP